MLQSSVVISLMFISSSIVELISYLKSTYYLFHLSYTYSQFYLKSTELGLGHNRLRGGGKRKKFKKGRRREEKKGKNGKGEKKKKNKKNLKKKKKKREISRPMQYIF